MDYGAVPKTDEEIKVEADARDRSRLMILYVSEDEILQTLCMGGAAEVYLTRYPGLPKGCEVRGVQYVFQQRAFAFTLWHIEFMPTEPYQYLPVLGDCARERVEYRRFDEAKEEAGRQKVPA